MSSTAYCVYQCNKCNNIVCDSLCNIIIDQDLRIITSDKAINVTALSKTKLVNDGPAEGATYLEIQCDNCKEIIGISFKSTTAETDIYRNMFSFYMDKIKVYTIGSCTLSRKENITESNVSNAILLSFDAERAQKDEESLCNLRSILDSLSKRVCTLEESKSL